MTVRKVKSIISIAPEYIDLLHDEGTAPVMVADESGQGVSADLRSVDGSSVAVHFIYGTIFYDWFGFSTRNFTDELAEADSNPNITAHLIVVDSPGGEVFYCHEAAAAIRECKKPVVAVCESVCASAAYWLASAADRIFAVSPFTEVGSIGVMARFLDTSEWYRMQGCKEIEIYASGSDLKNKVIKDVVNGKEQEYIKRFLDPVLEAMIDDIRQKRTIADGSDALRGEIYYANEAIGLGLIDGIKSIDEAFQEAVDLGEGARVMEFLNSNQ